MRLIGLTILVLGVGISVPLAAKEKPPKKSKEEKALEAFYGAEDSKLRSLVEIKDDQLEAVATLSTEPLLQVKQGLLGIINQDSFLRAFVNKATGDVKYQVVGYYRHGGNWAHLRSANYQAQDGKLNSVDVVSLGTDVSCGAYNGCTYFEAAGFDIAPADFHAEVSNAEAINSTGQRSGMLFKIKGTAGEFSDAIPGKEFRILDSVVKSYIANKS